MSGLMKSLIFVVGLIIFTAALIMAFDPPTNLEILSAIGSTNELPDSLKRALSIDGFEPIPLPGPNDWLAEHHENGQTFDEFIQSDHNSPDEIRNFIYLQPIGQFRREQSLIFVVGLIIFSASLIMAFEPPTNKETLSAIGSTNELPDSLQRALSIDDFEPIPFVCWLSPWRTSTLIPAGILCSGRHQFGIALASSPLRAMIRSFMANRAAADIRNCCCGAVRRFWSMRSLTCFRWHIVSTLNV